MWVDPPEKHGGVRVYISSAENARLGINLIHKEGIPITMIKDWDYLKSKTSDEIVIPDDKWETKMFVDGCLDKLLEKLKDKENC